MTFRLALQQPVAALALCVCAAAGAQSPPPAQARDAERSAAPCESISFDPAGTIKIPPGAKLPPQGVVVRVLIESVDTKSEPKVTVAFNSGDQAFADAVVAVARELRFACVKGGASPPRFQQEVQFVGGETPRVVEGLIRPVDVRSAADPASGCFKSAEGLPRMPQTLFTGTNIRRDTPNQEQAVVIVAMTFAGPDVAPEASILFSRGDKSLEAIALAYVAEHRWPCMKAGDPPLEAAQVFTHFKEEPNKGTLRQFLGAVDRITEQKVRFDFTTMGCPFSFRMTYLRPFLKNSVSEVGEPKAFRADFLAWLEQVSFKPELNPDNKLVGRDYEVSVPCLVLDLL